MSDIFREVEEEVKRDQVAQLLKKHGTLIISVLLVVVIGVGGYRAYEYWQRTKAAEAGQKFETALQFESDGKAAEARAVFDDLARSAPQGYGMLARFRVAGALVKSDRPAAIKAFEALAADTALDQTLRDLASVRAAMLQIETLPYADLKARLEAHAQAGKPWRLTARETLGLAAYKGGQMDEAGKQFDAMLADSAATQTVRQRAEMMLALIAGGAVSGQ